ncbi:MAG: metal-dependent transcriptional regulator [Eubacteriales bacterium]
MEVENAVAHYDYDISALGITREKFFDTIYRMSNMYGETMLIDDMSRVLQLKATTIVKMLKKYYDADLIRYKKNGEIELKQKGREIGRLLLYRHHVIKEFLGCIISQNILYEETEKMEKILNDETIQGLKELTEFLKNYRKKDT